MQPDEERDDAADRRQRGEHPEQRYQRYRHRPISDQQHHDEDEPDTIVSLTRLASAAWSVSVSSAAGPVI